jgi:CheY-like chemotaxis protein
MARWDDLTPRRTRDRAPSRESGHRGASRAWHRRCNRRRSSIKRKEATVATILVVDDEPELLSVIAETLIRAGHQVLRADSPDQALALFEEHEPDLVLTDIFMPHVGGLVVLMELAKRAPGRVIAMSGGGSRRLVEILEDAGAFGACRTLRKPFRQSELLDAVHETLGLPQAKLA